MKEKIVAFIPARSGSKRVSNKNIKILGKHPLMAYTISVALNSGIFDKVVCATDNQDYADIATYYGADVPFLRPANISGDTSPDIEWVKWMINELEKRGETFEVFSILRPTCPFRRVETIQRAWEMFKSDTSAHSLRAIGKCKEHPGKMWRVDKDRMKPILEGNIDGTPYHSSQYAALPEMYSQNASLEIAWTSVLKEFGTISGNEIIPFLSENKEGFDINNEDDWILLQHYIKKDQLLLPIIDKKPYISLSKNNLNNEELV